MSDLGAYKYHKVMHTDQVSKLLSHHIHKLNNERSFFLLELNNERLSNRQVTKPHLAI